MGRLPKDQFPTMRKHTRGHFFVRIDGRDQYLGRNEDAARQKYERIKAMLRPCNVGRLRENILPG